MAARARRPHLRAATTTQPKSAFEGGNAIFARQTASAKILHEEYHPYGTSAYRAAASGLEVNKRYRFNGKERDEETGLYDYGARYYAAWLARWTSADPLGIGADGPGVYNYTRGSPVTMTDPNGMQEADPGYLQSYYEDKEEQTDFERFAGAVLSRLAQNTAAMVQSTMNTGTYNRDQLIKSSLEAPSRANTVGEARLDRFNEINPLFPLILGAFQMNDADSPEQAGEGFANFGVGAVGSGGLAIGLFRFLAWAKPVPSGGGGGGLATTGNDHYRS